MDIFEIKRLKEKTSMINNESSDYFNTNLSTNFTRTDVVYADKRECIMMSRMMKKPVIHKVLEDAAEYTNDPFWKNKLLNAARGKFPKTFNYRDGFIVHRKRGTVKSVPLPQHGAEAVGVFITFLQDSGGIISDRDTQYNNNTVAIDEGLVENVILPWSKLPKKTRDDMIECYVVKCCKGWALNKKQADSFRANIYLGIRLGVFGKDNIVMDPNGNGIYNIGNIYYDEVESIFRIDENCMSNAVAKIKKKKSPAIHLDNSCILHSMYSSGNYKFLNDWSKLISHYKSDYISFQPINQIEEGSIIIIE